MKRLTRSGDYRISVLNVKGELVSELALHLPYPEGLAGALAELLIDTDIEIVEGDLILIDYVKGL